MLSKKHVLSILSLAGAVSSLVSVTGCVITAANPQQLQIEADIRDYHGNPAMVDFDYYLDMTLFDGTQLSYHKDLQQSRHDGSWSYTATNLQFYVGGTNCYDSCVSYDQYGCTAYATDCYNNSYSTTLQMSDVIGTAASIGVDTGNNYLVFPSSYNYATFKTYSSINNIDTFIQNDRFDTNLVVYGGNSGGLSPQSVNAGEKIKTEIKVSDEIAFKGMIRTAKPEIIKDLSTLTPEQMELLKKTRKHLGLPAEGGMTAKTATTVSAQ
jgi:hypothetical protein